MAKRPRWLVFVSLAFVAAVVIAVALVVIDREVPGSVSSLVDFGEQDDSSDAVDGESDAAAANNQLTATEEEADPGTSSRPKVKDKPAAPPAGPSDTELWQQYVAETKAVVENNEGDLREIVDLVTGALASGDEGALTDLLAPDEGDQSAFAAELSDKYPTILTSAPSSIVNIFTSDAATFYFAYVVVRWEDAGLTSEHTIPIMLRFVNGEWCITALGETGDLLFVQSVTL